MTAASGSIVNEEPQEYARTRVLSRLCASGAAAQRPAGPRQVLLLVAIEARKVEMQTVQRVDHRGRDDRARELLVVGRDDDPGRVRGRRLADGVFVGGHVGAPAVALGQI